LMMVEGFDIQAMAFAAPLIAQEWHIPAALFGPVFSAGLFGGIFGGALVAPFGDRWGARRLLIASTVCFGLFTLATAFAHSRSELIVLRLVAGLGIATAVPCVIAILSSYSPLRLRSTVVVAAFVFQLLGAVVGGALSARLMPMHGWAVVFLIGGISPLALAAAMIPLLPEPVIYLLTHQRQAQLGGLLEKMHKLPARTARHRIFSINLETRVNPTLPELLREGRATGTLFLWVTVLLGVMFFYFLANWLPMILRGGGVTVSIAVWGGVILNAGGAIGSLVFSQLIDRLGMVRTIAAGYLLGGLAILAVGHPAEALSLSMVMVFCCGFFGLGVQSCLVALTVRLYPPELHSTAVGSTFAFGRLGAVVGPLVGGYILSKGGAGPQLFGFAACAAILAGLATMPIRMPPNRSELSAGAEPVSP